MKRTIECCDWCGEPFDCHPTSLRNLRLHVECRTAILEGPGIFARELMFAWLAYVAHQHGVDLPQIDLHERVAYRQDIERRERTVRLD